MINTNSLLYYWYWYWYRYLCDIDILISIYLLNLIGLKPGGSCTVHIYAQTVHRTTQLIWD